MPGPTAPNGPGWTELADRVWCLQTSGTGVAERNTVVVGGARGLLLVDPPAADADPAGEAVLREGLATSDEGDVVGVALTHTHGLLAAGPSLVDWPGVPVHVHEQAAVDSGTPVRTFSSVAVVDLGDRSVELVHPGRAHTAGDLVVRIPDTDVVAVGGLAAGDDVPAYGPESFPLEWPGALDLLIGLTTPHSVVVPRSGRVLTRADLEEQRAGVGVVAETLTDLASRGIPVGEALGRAAWPFPAERLREAVLRGYDQLPRTARRLPLL
jgi:glyoxylase-like metal-dependent hydrolase (beta-lactamase superfamily II)